MCEREAWRCQIDVDREILVDLYSADMSSLLPAKAPRRQRLDSLSPRPPNRRRSFD